MRHAPAEGRLTLALSSPAPQERAARVFASVEVVRGLAAARDLWRALETAGGAYQTYRFAEAYAAAFGAEVCVAAARDATGEPLALLPLQSRRHGPLRVASLIGGSWANYRLGLFRPDRVWTAADVAALLRAAGKQAGIDLFAFSSLPADWEGRGNPLALLPGSSSPSAAFATRLPATHGEWLDAHLSRATQKKLRKKARKLEAFGPLRHVRREGEAGARFLDAFLTHKAAQAAARGERDAFAPAQVRDFLRRLLASGAMEMHALVAGERIAATLGALPCARRLSGLVISYDGAHEVAAASPGEWLVSEVVRDAVARGFSVFDLGAGEARYKRELCEIEESLRDAAFGVTPLGRLSAAGFLVARSAKGAIKRRPALFRLARRLRRAVSR